MTFEDDSPTIACPHCGHTISAQARFCRRCGNTTKSVPPTCAKCGAVAEATDALFCSKCGAALASSPPPAETTKACPSCGSTIPRAAKICGVCNSYLSREPALPAPQPEAATALQEDTRDHIVVPGAFGQGGGGTKVVVIALLLAGGFLALMFWPMFFRQAQEANGVTNTSPANSENGDVVRLTEVTSDPSHNVVIKGTFSNDFVDDDVTCNSLDFVLLGNETTVEPVDGGCSSPVIARGTSATFVWAFFSPSAGTYRFRVDKVPSGGTPEYEYHDVTVK